MEFIPKFLTKCAIGRLREILKTYEHHNNPLGFSEEERRIWTRWVKMCIRIKEIHNNK